MTLDADSEDKDVLKKRIYQALEAGSLEDARNLSDLALRRHGGFTMGSIALLCRLRQGDLQAARAIFNSLKPTQWPEALPRLEDDELRAFWPDVRPRLQDAVRQNKVASLMPLLRFWLRTERGILDDAIAALLELAARGACHATPIALALAIAVESRTPEAVDAAILRSAIAAALRDWPALQAPDTVISADVLALLPDAPLPPGELAAALTPLLAAEIEAGTPPSPALVLLRGVAAPTIQQLGVPVVQAYLEKHGDSDVKTLLGALADACGHAEEALGPGPTLRDLARQGVWLPLLLWSSRHDQRGKPTTDGYSLRHNPALARLRGTLRTAMAQARTSTVALRVLRQLEHEGDRETVAQALADRPELSETETGAMLVLWVAAASAEWRNPLPPFERYAGRLRTAGAIRRAMRLLIAELEHDQAEALLRGMPGLDRDEFQALWLEMLRSAGRLSEWSRAAKASGPLDQAGPALLRELLLWRDEVSGTREEPVVPHSDPELGTNPDAARARIRGLMLGRHFDAAIALASALATRSAAAGDAYAYILALCQAERFEQALGAAGIAQARFPADPRFANKLAQIAEALGDADLALHHWQVLGTLDRASVQAQCGTARALLDLGRADALRVLLTVLPAESVDHLWAHNLWALWLARQGDEAGARAAYLRGEELGRGFARHILEQAAADPDLAYVHGRWMRHPRPEHARSLLVFLRRFTEVVGDSARSCIIVGNSPDLLTGDLGATIDGFGTVVRLNDFSLEGYAAQTGRKTHIWYSSAHRQARKQDARDFDLALLGVSPAQQMPDAEELARFRLGLTLDSDRCCLLPPAYAALSAGAAYPKLTSGLRMIVLANYLSVREIHVCGFDFFMGHKGHYFDCDAVAHRPGETHVGRFERDLVDLVLAPFGRVRRLS
jgi:hypothetical protein